MDDPKALGPFVNALRLAALIAFFFGWFFFGVNVAGLAMQITESRCNGRRLGSTPIIVFTSACLSWVLLWVVLSLDPGRIFDWFMD